jgi:hypothetical protein
MHDYAYFLDWQVAYSLPFYAEFEEDPETTAAVDFVISDLIGTGVSSRDADVARIIPIMTRLLPAKALHALASAMELNARAIAINLDICRRLFGETDRRTGISERDYCAAFRETSSLDECFELIELTISLGHALRGLVHSRLLGATLHGMHHPAHAAGFGAMQDFLEKGYSAFHAIEDVDYFLDRFGERMREVFARVCTEPLENLDPDNREISVSR